MLTKFTVKRSEWGRGKFDGGMLLDPEGKKCCLGFFCEQSGIPSERIRNLAYPDELSSHFDDNKEMQKTPAMCNLTIPYTKYGVQRTQLASYAAKINDDTKISDEERENKLIKLFEEHSIKIVFED